MSLTFDTSTTPNGIAHTAAIMGAPTNPQNDLKAITQPLVTASDVPVTTPAMHDTDTLNDVEKASHIPLNQVVVMLLDNPYEYDNRVKREIQSLHDAGCTVVLFALKPDQKANTTPEQALPLSEHPLERVWVHRVIEHRHLYFHRKLSGVKYVWALLRHIQKQTRQHIPPQAGKRQVDVIHVHDLKLLPFGVLLKWMTGAKLVYDSHEYWDAWIGYKLKQYLSPTSGTGSVEGRKLKYEHFSLLVRLQRQLLPHCDALITVSPTLCQKIVSQVTKPPKHITLLRNVPVRQPSLQTAERTKPRKFHEYFGLPPETLVFLYQGVVDPSRGLDRVVRALPLAQSKNICVVAMGPVETPQYLANLQAMAPQGQFYHHPGVYGSDFPEWTASADVGLVATLPIHESYYYSLPNKLFEFIQAGLPVMNPDFPDSAELVNHYGLGVNYDIDSPEAIAQTIDQLAQNVDLRASLAEHSQQAAQTLHWGTESQQLLKLYQSFR